MLPLRDVLLNITHDRTRSVLCTLGPCSVFQFNSPCMHSCLYGTRTLYNLVLKQIQVTSIRKNIWTNNRHKYNYCKVNRKARSSCTWNSKTCLLPSSLFFKTASFIAAALAFGIWGIAVSTAFQASSFVNHPAFASLIIALNASAGMSTATMGRPCWKLCRSELLNPYTTSLAFSLAGFVASLTPLGGFFTFRLESCSRTNCKSWPATGSLLNVGVGAPADVEIATSSFRCSAIWDCKNGTKSCRDTVMKRVMWAWV